VSVFYKISVSALKISFNDENAFHRRIWRVRVNNNINGWVFKAILKIFLDFVYRVIIPTSIVTGKPL
jgi:hypothetical protein